MIRVHRVNIPAMSSIGYGEGKDDETGETVNFIGDHRPMRELGERIRVATSEEELPLVEPEDWQVVGKI